MSNLHLLRCGCTRRGVLVICPGRASVISKPDMCLDWGGPHMPSTPLWPCTCQVNDRGIWKASLGTVRPLLHCHCLCPLSSLKAFLKLDFWCILCIYLPSWTQDHCSWSSREGIAGLRVWILKTLPQVILRYTHSWKWLEPMASFYRWQNSLNKVSWHA